MRILPVICYFFFSLVCTTAAPVPYAGKIALNGANFNGTAQFIFELRDSEGTVHWRNGAKANASISVPVDRGHYVVLLGGQGMNPLSGKLFLEQPELYLQVRFYSAETQEWLHMLPDHGITSVPHALAADMANLANLAKAVEPGAITRSMLAAEILADLNASVAIPQQNAAIQNGSITRDMLSTALRSDLNRTVEITRGMLSADVLNDLNRSIVITRSMLPAEVLADLNATITRSRLAADVLSDLDAGIAPDSVTLSMLAPQVRSDINSTISRSRLAAEVLADLNATITRSRLAADVLSDLDAGIAPDSVTLSMLAPQVRSDINSTISRSRLAADVLVDLNRTIPPATVTKTMLAADVLADLGSTIAPGSITSSLLAPGLLAELNSTTPEASVTASKMHPDLIKYFLPEISSHPVGASVLRGTGATLSSEATGKFLTYQWQRNGVDLSGKTNATLVFTSANAAHDANYTVVVSNDWGSVTSNVSTFNVATNSPVITLVGINSATHEAATSYTDAGATAVDALDGNLTASIVVAGNDFNNTAIGDHNVTFNVSDAGGNAAAQKVRTVTVVDTTDPVITLIGDSNVSHGINTAWNDPGVTATDTLDGNLSAQVSISGTVDVNQTGTSILTYSVSDAAGNVATAVTRGVQVVQLHHALLTGTPNPATVFNTIDQTYFFSNNLNNVIWHKASGKILSGHFSSPGYWSFTAGTSGYSVSPDKTPGGSFARMVHMPAQNVVVYNNAGGNQAIPHNSIYIADINSSTGLLNNRRQVSFSDNFTGTAKLSSSSATEFIFYDGSGIRHYSVANGSSVLTYTKTVSLSQAPSFDGSSYCFGGTFAWDGMYYYFTKNGSGQGNRAYDVYNSTGIFVDSYTASGSGNINSVYFDWSVGRYSTHDGFGSRSGGATHAWQGGSGNDSQNFSPVSSVHTTPGE